MTYEGGFGEGEYHGDGIMHFKRNSLMLNKYVHQLFSVFLNP